MNINTNGLKRIHQGIHSLNPSEKKVARFIIEKPQDILNMSIAKLGEQCGVSEATIIRMCRSLHFKDSKN
ncbi:MAG: hypothetical protein LRY73_12225 [Bacillus sp. (in: Bacteria)]|nr:hypothetical protein [Bacillus sp. (in: firmicutes)]